MNCCVNTRVLCVDLNEDTSSSILVGFTENFCIDLSGGQRKMYQRLCCTRVGK